MKLREIIFTKQIETDRSVQTVWCEYAWKMSVNSKGSTLSLQLQTSHHSAQTKRYLVHSRERQVNRTITSNY